MMVENGISLSFQSLFLFIINECVSLYVKGHLIRFPEICLFIFFLHFSVGLLVFFLIISRSFLNMTDVITMSMT